ncbi:MAG: hypothetical protein M3453_17175, partial [Pseudomonadota bacterium]|nr:hypothetical protein [Pseudomonadota bacterium]
GVGGLNLMPVPCWAMANRLWPMRIGRQWRNEAIFTRHDRRKFTAVRVIVSRVNFSAAGECLM